MNLTPPARRKIVLGMLVLCCRRKEICAFIGFCDSTIDGDITRIYRTHGVRTISELIHATWAT
jgi:DNA-binding NarL/FixJ family response regulator